MIGLLIGWLDFLLIHYFIWFKGFIIWLFDEVKDLSLDNSSAKLAQIERELEKVTFCSKINKLENFPSISHLVKCSSWLSCNYLSELFLSNVFAQMFFYKSRFKAKCNSWGQISLKGNWLQHANYSTFLLNSRKIW